MNKQVMFYEENFPKNFNKVARTILEENPSKPVEEVIAEATEEAKKVTKEQAVYIYDKEFYRVAIWFLGLIVLAVVIGGLFLTYFDKSPTDGIIAIGSAAVGAIVGIFSTSK
ncbi:MAG: hypothetical protein R2741_15415 [Methanolobus sp.]